MFSADVDINKMTMTEVLHSALVNEKGASDAYKELSQIFGIANKPILERVFIEMSNVEKGHYKRLLKALSCYEDQEVFSEDEAAWTTSETLLRLETEGISDEIDLDGMDMKEAVDLFKNNEKDSEAFYLSAAQKTERKDLQALFKNLAEEEAKHHRLINKIVTHALMRGHTPQRQV
ncbi:MAG: ferritin family protein [Nitrospinota bacterium]